MNENTRPRAPEWQEYFGLCAFFVLIGLLLGRLGRAVGAGDAWLILAMAVIGFVASDFFSGFVHWLFDTWGNEATPVVGKTFITLFRTHHSDPKDITRHGFIATNGNNCLVSLLVLVPAALLPSATWATGAIAFIVFLTLGVFGTNQFHKWAHCDTVPPLVGWLQHRRLILSPDHHDIHHTAPYDQHYCITTGWLNEPLRAIGFFRGMERLINAVTGADPRRDDLKTAV